ncbi:MAG TPA: hypothetical protein VM290_11770 [Gaiellaceae bacterium]|nr:hypothetical protein [Gaiellaceae bacterium]
MLDVVKRHAGKKPILTLVVAGVVFSSAFAFAATLAVGSQSLSAGSAAVGSCDADGVSVSYTTAYDAALPGYKVTAVTVSGIDATNCANRALKVDLVNAANVSIGSGTATVNASSLNVSITTGTANAAQVATVHAVIAG